MRENWRSISSARHNDGMGRKLVVLLVAACLAATVRSQSGDTLPDAPIAAKDAATIRNLPRNILRDQRGIWTAPMRMSNRSAVMGLIFVAAAGALGSEDTHIMRTHFTDLNNASRANTASNGLAGLFVAAPLAYYGIGYLHRNSRYEQTGIMAGEAMLNSAAIVELMKVASRRERPAVDNARGKFFQTGAGFNSSFASNHSAIAWSSAAVLASSQHSTLAKIGIYGLATGVSMSRIVGRDHFPSDVLVGSAVGWVVGRYVYRHHHLDEK